MKYVTVIIALLLLVAACSSGPQTPDAPANDSEVDLERLVGTYSEAERRAAQEIIAIEQGEENPNAITGNAVEFVRSVEETLQFLGCTEEPSSGVVSVDYSYNPPGGVVSEGTLTFMDSCGDTDYFCTDQIKMGVEDAVCDGTCFDEVTCLSGSIGQPPPPPSTNPDLNPEESITAFLGTGNVTGEPITFDTAVNVSDIDELAACQYWLYHIMDRFAQGQVDNAKARESVEGAYKGGGPQQLIINQGYCSGELVYHPTRQWTGEEVATIKRSRHFVYAPEYVPSNWNELLEYMEVDPGYHMFLPILMGEESDSLSYGFHLSSYGPMLYVNDIDYSSQGYGGAPWASGNGFHVTDAPINFPALVAYMKWASNIEYNYVYPDGSSMRLYPQTQPLDMIVGPPSYTKTYDTQPQQYGGVVTENCQDRTMCRSKDSRDNTLHPPGRVGCSDAIPGLEPDQVMTVIVTECSTTLADGTTESSTRYMGTSSDFTVLGPECHQYEIEAQKCRQNVDGYRIQGGNVGYYCLYSDRQAALECGAPNVGPWCLPSDEDTDGSPVGCIGGDHTGTGENVQGEINKVPGGTDPDAWDPLAGTGSNSNSCEPVNCAWKVLEGSSRGGQCECENPCRNNRKFSYPADQYCPDQGGDDGGNDLPTDPSSMCTYTGQSCEWCDNGQVKAGTCVQVGQGGTGFVCGGSATGDSC